MNQNNDTKVTGTFLLEIGSEEMRRTQRRVKDAASRSLLVDMCDPYSSLPRCPAGLAQDSLSGMVAESQGDESRGGGTAN